MADVSVEFGAKDTGLEQTLKTVQDELTKLESEVKSGELSFDALQQTMRKLAQTERLQEQLQGMAEATKEVGEAAERAAEPARDLSEEFKKISEPLMTLEQRLSATSAELDELREKAATAHMSSEELNATLKKIAELEATERKLEKLSESMTDAGDAASGAAPQIDDSADSMDEVGTSATDAGEKSEMGFLQMAGAVAAGQAAVELAMGAIKGAIDGVVGMFDKFGQALDKGAQLDVLSSRTGVASGELSRLGRALENTGASSDMLGPIFDRMNRALAGSGEDGGKAGKALEKLGINIENLKTLSPDQQFELIGKSLSNVADRSERVDMAMDIFGRGSGSRLLRLFNDYEGTMAQVDRQLGTFPSIMDAMSASFESASTEINAAKQKMVEFATGILSRVMPAIESIAMGLASIDAAALGQKLADAFTGGTAAMQGFQSAIDAIKLGEFGLAFELIFESIKLQLMQTGNEIVRIFSSAFKTAGEIISEVFREDGPTFMLIRSAFDYVAGYAKEKIAGAMSEMFASMGPAFANISKSLEQHANAGAKAAELALLRIPSMAELAAEDIATVLGKSPEKFIENLDKSKSSFFDIEAQSKKVAELQEEIAEKVEETNKKIQSKVISEEEAAEEARKYFQQYQDGVATIDDQNVKKTESITRQIALNEAIANGNIEEQKRIEALIESDKRAADIAKKTAEIVKQLGLGEKQAEMLATRFVDSEIAARSAKNEFKSVRETMADIENAKLEASPQRLKDRTIDARRELKRMADFIGENISGMSLDDILKKLGLDPNSFETTDEKLKALEGAIQKIGSADPADITPDVDLVGVNDKLEAVKSYLARVTKPDATPEVNENQVQQAAGNAKSTLDNAVGSVDSDVKPKINDEALSAVIAGVKDELEASRPRIVAEVDQAALNDAVSQLQAEITNHFTGGEGGQGGQGGEGGQGGVGGNANAQGGAGGAGGQGVGGTGGIGGPGGDATADVQSLVNILNPWTEVITAIRDRLPLQALAY
jgi:hypothetical protein